MSHFALRRDKIRKQFKKCSVDAFLVTNPVNIRYLTGFTGTDSYVVIKKSGDADVLLSDGRFTIQIEEECPGLEAYIRSGKETMPEVITAVLGKKTSGQLAVEADTMTLAERDKLTAHLRSWQLAPLSGVVEELRQIKDRGEIDSIRQAIDVAHGAFDDVRKILRTDLSEIDVRNDLEFLMRLQGAEEKSFPSIIGAGPRAALPHGVPSSNKIGGHSHLLIDWGSIVDGYMSDLTRVLILSPKDKKLRKIYDIVLKAQQAAIDAIEPGKTTGEIDAVARNIISDAGYGKYFNHGLGHSFGLEIHEAPRFSMGWNTILKPGMVMSVEPGIYLKDWGGIRIEDDIVVTKKNCEVLSRNVPKSFEEMTVEFS